MAGLSVVAGDWNSGRKCLGDICLDSVDDMQIPSTFRTNYLIGTHFDGYVDRAWEPTAVYLGGLARQWLDAAFSNFGQACVDCGAHYNTTDLVHGSAVGSYGIPRADGGWGCDHRRVFVLS
jgi:hypothetical protein